MTFKLYQISNQQNKAHTSPSLENYEELINKIFRDINYWFKLNQVVLNYNKTHYLQFNT